MTSAPPRPWTPDVDLPPEAAARLISTQFADLPSPHLEPIGRGWDNDAYRVNRDFVFRFPRRKLAEVCMRNEIASLPRFAGSLPLAVPVPTHVGRAAEGYPYPFVGYRWIAGRTACSVALDAEARRKCAGPLARFLAKLHALPVPEAGPEGAPEDPAGRKDVARLVERSLAWLKGLSEVAAESEAASAKVASRVVMSPAELAAARATIEGLAGTAEWDGSARWSHGDLYARHLLVDERSELCGVIDWGDVHAGETADDLSIAYSFLAGEARAEFFAAYGEVDRATADRARLYALHCGGVLAWYGREVGDGALLEAGRVALGFAVR